MARRRGADGSYLIKTLPVYSNYSSYVNASAHGFFAFVVGEVKATTLWHPLNPARVPAAHHAHMRMRAPGGGEPLASGVCVRPGVL